MKTANSQIRITKQISILLVATLVVLFLSSCKKIEQEYKFFGNTMGTTYSVTLFGILEDEDLENLKKGIDAELEKVNSSMSNWDKNSNISKFNQAKAGSFVKMPKDIVYLVELAKQIGKKSENQYDISIGALIDLWGFGSKGSRDKPPSEEQIQATLKKVGIDKIQIDLENNRIKKSVEGLELNLSSIAKGFGVDKVATYLKGKGLNNFLIEVGGELRASGTKFGKKAWEVGIEKPLKSGKLELQKVIELKDMAIATSGNYKNYFKYGDKYYGHTINPKTGETVMHNLLSVSVISNECAYSDGWATALMALGDKKAYQIAQKENLIAYFLINTAKGIEVKYTDGFEKLFKD